MYSLHSSYLVLFLDAWQSPQQHFARIRKSEDNSPGFRFLGMEQIKEPSFNLEGNKEWIREALWIDFNFRSLKQDCSW